ncbi:MAG: hypothetical protein Q9165_004321 [Trypethelium subeluteriae]
MPAQGDLQRDVSTLPNPFEDIVPRVNEYTAKDIATLQSRLDKQLGPEYISSRPGAGGSKVYYLAAEKAINLANEVFGFNGWSSAIKNVQIDFVDEDRNTGKISLGLSIIVRVTLKDGSFHEDIGYGHIENCKGKAAAFEKAKKEAATDALKRALRNFGNILGNCLYDRDYLQRVTKVKAEPSRWDVDNLHRHHDYAPVKKEPATDIPMKETSEKLQQSLNAASESSHTGGDYDEFGGDVFEGTDMTHPDEVMLDSFINEKETMQPKPVCQRGGTRPQPQSRQQIPRTKSMPVLQPSNNGQLPSALNAAQTPAILGQEDGRPRATPPYVNGNDPAISNAMPPPPPMPNQAEHQPPTRSHVLQTNKNPNSSGNNHPVHESENSIPRAPLQRQSNPQQSASECQEPSIGFITSRAAEILTKSNTPPTQANPVPAFNPHAESPSIRRTSGINHAKSEPIVRKNLAAPAGQTPGPPLGPLHESPNNAAGANLASRPTKSVGQGPANFVNPQSDPSRRIGMPAGGAPSPLANRGGYRPPVMKRPAPGSEAPGAEGERGRMPLTDVSNLTVDIHAPSSGGNGVKGAGAGAGTHVETGGDSKRMKVDGG